MASFLFTKMNACDIIILCEKRKLNDMWLVVCQHSAFEVTFEEFDNYVAEKEKYYEYKKMYHLFKIFLSEIKKQS